MERLFRLKTVVDSGSEDLSKMNFDISDEQKLILDEVDRACQELRPLEDQAYLAGKFNDHLIPIFKKAQLLGLPISRRYGEGQAQTFSRMPLLWRGSAGKELGSERFSLVTSR